MIRSAIVYNGNKYRLLDWLIPLFPKECDIFLDAFGGSGVVCLNYRGKNSTIYNEKDSNICEMLDYIQQHTYSELEDCILYYMDLFDLFYIDVKNPQLKENYLTFRNFYNTCSEPCKPILLYMLHQMAFGHNIEFNKQGVFNSSFGQYIITTKKLERLKTFCDNFKNIIINNDDFLNMDLSFLTENSFVYLDPPYLGTDGVYNKDWNEQDNNKLLNLLVELNSRGIKWGLSNVLKHGDKDNTYLQQWCNEHNFHMHTKDVTYRPRGKLSDTVSTEVYICNYEV